MIPPRLTPQDTALFERWSTVCLQWADGPTHAQRLTKAIGITAQFIADHPDAYIACSGGKDSVALVDLVVATIGQPQIPVMHTWDEFSFPDMIEYLTGLCQMDRWRIGMDVVNVVGSQQILQDRAAIGQAWADDDYCSRSSVKSWFDCIANYAKGRPVLLGLRAEESSGRQKNRNLRGPVYQKADGQWVCCPIVDWHGIDVYAYLLMRRIPLHPVYHCVRLHERPDRVRLNGWLVGAHARKGAMIWLRAYYPSLHRRLVEILPDARTLV